MALRNRCKRTFQQGLGGAGCSGGVQRGGTRSPPALAAWRGDPEGWSPLSPGSETAARYIAAGMAAGVRRDAGEAQVTDELLGTVLLSPRAGGPRGESWARLEAEREFGEERRGRSQAGQDPGLGATARGESALPNAAPLLRC